MFQSTTSPSRWSCGTLGWWGWWASTGRGRYASSSSTSSWSRPSWPSSSSSTCPSGRSGPFWPPLPSTVSLSGQGSRLFLHIWFELLTPSLKFEYHSHFEVSFLLHVVSLHVDFMCRTWFSHCHTKICRIMRYARVSVSWSWVLPSSQLWCSLGQYGSAPSSVVTLAGRN